MDSLNYTLLQFHFHRPSEHTLNGKRFAAEAHFVYRSLATGLISVFGVVFDDPATLNMSASTIPDNPLLATFWGQIHTPTFNVFVNASACEYTAALHYSCGLCDASAALHAIYVPLSLLVFLPDILPCSGQRRE